MTSGGLNIGLSKKKKKHRNTFVMISDELSNSIFRFSLRGLGANLEEEGGGGSYQPLRLVMGNSEAHQRTD